MSDNNNEEAPKTDINAKEEPFSLLIILGLFAAAIATPFIILNLFGIYWAALSSFIIMIAWFSKLPTTCIGGGLIFSLLAFPILLSGIGYPIFAGIDFFLN